MRISEIHLKIIVLITIQMHVFSNLVANLLAAVMNLESFQAAGTKEKVAHPWPICMYGSVATATNI